MITGTEMSAIEWKQFVVWLESYLRVWWLAIYVFLYFVNSISLLGLMLYNMVWVIPTVYLLGSIFDHHRQDFSFWLVVRVSNRRIFAIGRILLCEIVFSSLLCLDILTRRFSLFIVFVTYCWDLTRVDILVQQRHAIFYFTPSPNLAAMFDQLINTVIFLLIVTKVLLLGHKPGQFSCEISKLQERCARSSWCWWF